MTETRTVCDRCRKEIKGFPRMEIRKMRKKILGIRTIYGHGAYDYTDEKLELCPKCLHEFWKWIKKKEED